MKKIVVFGGAGFVGSRLCPLLQQKYDVTVVDTFWFWDDVEQYKEVTGVNAKCVVEDIREHSIRKLLRGKDAVISLACLSNDTSSDVDYGFTHDVSYNGVMNVIDASIEKKIPKIIQTSTTSVYGIKQGKLVTEKDIPEPITQYGKIKAEIDHVLGYYIKKGGVGITSLRPATLYGYSPRLRLDVMVNTMLDRAIRENRLMVEGGEQCRPCLHVDDLCLSYELCLENPISNGKIYNVTNENYSVNQVVELIQDAIPDVEIHYQHVIDQRSYRTSSALIKKDLGIKFKKRLKGSIRKLHQEIMFGKHDRSKSINVRVIKKLLRGGIS
tara:strand:- start:1098 stop:2075 length:978 start_codon:yes stop_codon:yes gene_type:complete